MVSMGCKICDNRIYRSGLCKVCFINDRKQYFHCTHNKCISPVFALTLCQKHYKMYKSSCLLCSKKIHCKNVCRKHYQDYLDKKIIIKQPVCKYCFRTVYLNKLCLKHFKDKYSFCMVNTCKNKNHKRGLCCAHYFRYRRKGLI